MDENQQRQPRIVVFEQLMPLGVHYSRRQLDRLEVAGKFPKRVPLGVGKVGWLTAEIVALVDSQIASRSLDAGTLGSGDLCRRARKPRTAPLLGKAATDAAKLRSA